MKEGGGENLSINPSLPEKVFNCSCNTSLKCCRDTFFNDDLLFMHYKNDVKMYAAIKGFMQCVVCGID